MVNLPEFSQVQIRLFCIRVDWEEVFKRCVYQWHKQQDTLNVVTFFYVSVPKKYIASIKNI